MGQKTARYAQHYLYTIRAGGLPLSLYQWLDSITIPLTEYRVLYDVENCYFGRTLFIRTFTYQQQRMCCFHAECVL